MNTSETITLKRYFSIDIIKFIMSVLIVFHHFQQSTGIHFERIPNFYGGNFDFGLCVEFFFLISGFLTAASIEEKSKRSFKEFIIPKLIRLYPMAILSTVITMIIMLTGRIVLNRWFSFEPDAWTFFASVFMIFSSGPITDLGQGINNPLWYICSLVLCYILLWVVHRIYRKLNMSVIYGYAVVFFVSLGMINSGIILPFIIGARGYASFFLGLILYRLFSVVSERELAGYSLIILIVNVLFGIVDSTMLISNQRYTFAFVIFPAILLLGVSVEKMIFGNLKDNVKFSDGRKGLSKFVTELGAISFEIYVWHSPAILLLQLIGEISGRKWNYNFILMSIFTVIIMVYGTIMYYGAEKRLENAVKGLFNHDRKEVMEK